MTFGSRLKELRKERKLIQEDVGKIAGVHRATIGKYETDERFPERDILVKLSTFFDVSIDFLLGVSDIRKPCSNEQQPKNVLQKIFEELSTQDQKELENFAKYLKTKSLLQESDQVNSNISENSVIK